MQRRPPSKPPPDPPPHRFLVRLIAIGGIVAAILIAAVALTPRRLNNWDEMWLAPMAIVAIPMTMQLAASRRPLGGMGRQVLAVLIFFIVLMVGYSYHNDLGGIFDRALGVLAPSRGVQVAPGVMQFTADSRGQFHLDAKVDGVGIQFLVDTGASGIALSREDARALGFDLDDLRFTELYSTANGMTRGAPVTLDSVQIGPLSATHVRASVNEGDLDESLLGMSYLSTLGRIEIKGDQMTIEQ
jgi:aspartyl protease family protein